MENTEVEKTQHHRICHCGKCKIKCNKHGLRAKCADCGKTRMLGTIVEKGAIRHCCGACCDRLKKEAHDKLNHEINELVSLMRDGDTVPNQNNPNPQLGLQDPLGNWPREEDEIFIPEGFCEVDA